MPRSIRKRVHLGQCADPVVGSAPGADVSRAHYFCRSNAVAMRILLTLLACCLSASFAVAQSGCDYFSFKYTAESHGAASRYDSAVVYYRKAFNIHKNCMRDLLNAAGRAVSADSLDAARDFLGNAFQLGFNWDDYQTFLLHVGQGKLDTLNFTGKQEWEALFNTRNKGFDEDLIDRIKKMADRDQRYRGDSEEDFVKMIEADSLNALDLKRMVSEKGRLPGFTDIGPEGLDDLELLFVHMNYNDLRFFTPFIISGIRRGEYFGNEGLAYQIDRLAVSSGEALYIDAQDRLQQGGRMPDLTPHASWSVMGVWYDQDPETKKLIEWPVYPGTAIANTSRSRLCLDTVEAARARMPWIQKIDFKKFTEIFGRH